MISSNHLEGMKGGGNVQMRDDSIFSNWKERYLCIEGDKLFYFDSEHDLEHLGYVELRLITHVGKRQTDPQKNKWIV
jgi:hypothetical protein